MCIFMRFKGLLLRFEDAATYDDAVIYASLRGFCALSSNMSQLTSEESMARVRGEV
jgi:hypothetical protein